MKIHLVILNVLVMCGTISAQGTWTPLEHDGKTSIVYNWKGVTQTQKTPSIEGLAAALAAIDESAPLKEISFRDYYNNFPPVQAEVEKELRAGCPELFAPRIAIGSGGPVVPMQIEKILTEPLMKTPTIAKLNEVLGIYGYSINRIDFRTTFSKDDKQRVILTPKLQLIISPKVKKDAEQDAPSNGG